MVFLLNQINHQRLAFSENHTSTRNNYYAGQDDTQSHSISIRPPTKAKKDIMSFEETTSEHNFLQFFITDDENQITISSSSCESSDSMSGDDTAFSSSDLSDQCPKISAEVTNQHVNRSLSIFGDLTKNPTFWEYLTNNLMYNDLELTANLSKLMFCLNQVEREFAWFYADHDSDVYFLDGTFMLNIAFLVYEQSEGQLMKLKSSTCDTIAVFDLDLSETVEDSSSDETFEQLVESNLSVLKQYLPSIIQINTQRERLEKGSGKDILKQLRDYLTNKQSPEETNKSELECSFLAPNLSNIDEALFEPGTFEFDSNPISKSYRPLVSNLKALNFLTYDPFREADELSAHYGTEVDICTLACLSFSYLTMGQQLTMAKKCFFENTNQFLHELKSFYHEFECVFDDIEQNEPNFSLSQFNSDNVENTSDENSKWDYTETFDKQSTQEEATPLFDEILDRISSINEFGTQLSRSSNNSVDQLEYNRENGIARNWTVAPKLFTANTINGAGQQSYSSDFSSDLKSCRVYSDNSKNKKNNWNSKSTELRPIGTKSASMSSIRTGGYQNRHVLKMNESSIPGDRAAAQKEVLKNVWDHDSAEQETFSNSSFLTIGPYLFYGSEDSCPILSQTLNADCSAQKNTIYKANVNTYVIKTTSNNNNGKYSVAPLSFHSSSMEPMGQQYHQKTGHQFYRRQSIYTFYNSNSSSNGENSSLPTLDENQNSSRQGQRSTHQRKYHNSFSSQYDDNARPLSGDQTRPTVHQHNQQSSQRHSNRNYHHQQRNNFPKQNANVRKPTGGKSVYNSDAFNNDDSFRNSYSEGCSFPPKSRSNRRRY